MNENKTAEEKDINLIAIKSLIECIDNRDIAEGGVFLDDDNAEFVADILRYHYESLTTENKIAKVAKLFGKELGEEFEINDGIRNLKCKITDKGVFIHAGIYNEWWYNSEALAELLTGKAVIVDD